MRYLFVAFLLLPFLTATTRAAEAPTTFIEPEAVLLNVSEHDLNRIIVDAFHRNGGPLFEGEKARVSSSVGDLRYHARFSDPVIRLGESGTGHLSLDILDASLRIGRLEKKIAGRQALCEQAGVDVDPASPLAVDLEFDLSVANGSLRLAPKSVEIPEVGDRIRLVKPERCENAPFPRWLLWWLGKPYLRRSIGNLHEIVLARARTSAARLEAKSSLLTKRWEFTSLRLIPETLDTSGGSLLFGLTASSAGPSAQSAPPRRIGGSSALPSGTFLGVSESFVNETARRVVTNRVSSQGQSTRFRKLMASDAVYALVPGLRKLDSKASVYFDVVFPSAPRFEFRPRDGSALIRVLLTGVAIEIRKEEAGQKTLLGTLRVDSGRMAVVPFTNLLGGVSFRLVENQWKVSSTGLEFDEALAAATLQEVTFSTVFATSYEPLLSRALHVGETEFVPQSFTVADRYLVIGLGEPPRAAAGTTPPAVTARRTRSPLGSR